MIYEDDDIFIEWERSEIPWVKIFTKTPCKEITECPEKLRAKLWRTYERVERAMREHFRPDKINMASFGNYLPRVHLHVMARFEKDSHFPEPMWGARQRKSGLEPFDREGFEARLREALKEGESPR